MAINWTRQKQMDEDIERHRELYDAIADVDDPDSDE